MYTRVVSMGGGVSSKFGGGGGKGLSQYMRGWRGGDSLERTRTRLLVTFGLKIDKNAVINIGSTQ